MYDSHEILCKYRFLEVIFDAKQLFSLWRQRHQKPEQGRVEGRVLAGVWRQR